MSASARDLVGGIANGVVRRTASYRGLSPARLGTIAGPRWPPFSADSRVDRSSPDMLAALEWQARQLSRRMANARSCVSSAAVRFTAAAKRTQKAFTTGFLMEHSVRSLMPLFAAKVGVPSMILGILALSDENRTTGKTQGRRE